MSDPAAVRPLNLMGAALVASVALVVSLVTSVVVASRAYLGRGEQAQRQARTLDVTGSARARITADLGVWTIRAAGEAKTLEEAYRKLDPSVQALRAFLRECGFPDSAVETGAIDTSIHLERDAKGNETRKVDSYLLTRRIRVTLADVERVARAAGEVTELLKSGVQVESGAPEYVYTKIADLKIRMIGEATANARLRAERIAEGTRCRLGAVKDARAGVLQITRPWSTDTSSGGMNDTSTVEKDVTSVVQLTFVIEP